jgi:hypothetical protein
MVVYRYVEVICKMSFSDDVCSLSSGDGQIKRINVLDVVVITVKRGIFVRTSK